MNVGQILQAVRREGPIPMRDVISRFDGRNPDVLGPPGRQPLFDEVLGDPRLGINRGQPIWTVRER